MPSRPPSPASSSRPWRRRLAPVEFVRTAAGTQLRIAWGRLAAWFVVLGLAGWPLAVTAVYLWVILGRGFTDVRYLDLAIPSRWPNYRITRGDFFIRQAQDDVRQKRWGEAVHRLRIGVSLSPRNVEGRLLLARILLLAGQSEMAKRTLLDGIDQTPGDIEYLRAMFGFLLEAQDDEEVRRLAAGLLPPKPEVNRRNQLVAVAAANANYFRGYFDAAEALISDYNLFRAADGILLLAHMDWDRGFRDQALERLRQAAADNPADDRFLAQLSAFYREIDRLDEVERISVLRQIARPEDPAPRLELLYVYRRRNDVARLERETAELFRVFADQPAGLLAIGNFAAAAGDVPLAQRVYQHCRARSLAVDAAALMLVESQVVARQYGAALAEAIALTRDQPTQLGNFPAALAGLQAVASFGLNQPDEGNLYLATFLKLTSQRTENLNIVARRLVEVGAAEPAHRLLAQAADASPRNQAILASLVALDLDRDNLAALPANVRRLLAVRRPPVPLLQRAARILNEDRALFVPGRDEVLIELENYLALAATSFPRTAR